ncbi:MAG: iron-containing alcohol dehydrogenase family protein [Candidatus Hodarchaeota archaeon]
MSNQIIGFTFRSPTIIFGRNSLDSIGSEVRDFGDALLVTGKSAMKKARFTDKITDLLKKEKLNTYLFDKIDPEPTVEILDECFQFARECNVSCVIGLGGGSVLDASKPIAALYRENIITVSEFMGKKFTKPGIPFIAIPSTSGTGSEVTKNSVIRVMKEGRKYSIFRDPSMIARIAILDPYVTATMPPRITAASGMDALVQAIECFISLKANTLSNLLSINAIEIIGKNLKFAVKNGQDIDVREKLAYGSLISGLAFSNGGLGAIHGLAHPIGFQHNVPHGVICALLLPHVMEFNKDVCKEKFAVIAEKLDLDIKNKSIEERANLTINFINTLIKEINLPTKLSELNIKESNIPNIVKDTKGSSLNANPRKATPEFLTKILKNAL